MPPKVKVPDGEMKMPELKRLIKKYDELMGIDPKGMSRDDLIKAIEKLKYRVDHKNKTLVLTVSQKVKKQPINQTIKIFMIFQMLIKILLLIKMFLMMKD